MDFDWDEAKARQNQRKHRVSFAEARTVFLDPLAAIFADIDHSDEEDREIIIGYSEQNHLLVVSFAERHEIIRIISARKATPRERRNHEEKAPKSPQD